MRDNRYDQIIHLITAANGAEEFYRLDNNACRTEGIEQARQIDEKCARAWVGHPYFGAYFEIDLNRIFFRLMPNKLNFFYRCD